METVTTVLMLVLFVLAVACGSAETATTVLGDRLVAHHRHGHPDPPPPAA